MDAQNKLKMEEYAEITEQSSNYAVAMGATEKPRMEEFASNMGRHWQRNDAVVKDAQIKSSKEECALNMEQRSNCAVLMDAQITLMFVGPQVLNHLIQFLRNSKAPWSQGVGLTLLVTFSQIAMSISLRHYFYKCAVLVDYKLRLR